MTTIGAGATAAGQYLKYSRRTATECEAINGFDGQLGAVYRPGAQASEACGEHAYEVMLSLKRTLPALLQCAVPPVTENIDDVGVLSFLDYINTVDRPAICGCRSG